MSNYYVRRSGEDDYLEHAGGWKWSKPTKYIDKIMKNGRWVYVYARNKANSVASNVRRSFNRATGLSDRRAANIARNRWRESLKGGNRAYTHTLRARANKFQNRYNKSLLGRAESALSRVSSAGANARNAMAKAAANARKAGEGFTGSIKRGVYAVDKAVGVSARGNMVKAKKAKDAKSRVATDAIKQNTSVKDKALRNSKIAARQYRHARHNYNKTLLGRAEGALDDARGWLDERVHPLKAKGKGLRRKLKKKSKNAYLGFKNATTGKRT